MNKTLVWWAGVALCGASGAMVLTNVTVAICLGIAGLLLEFSAWD